ncbi:MAG: nucleoside monophosphate kinase [Candidatus Moranbacteria bacterium]|nr:nucleoside monophosphate kinase [Candidatus Moranbacteria bacterium]
MNLIIFGPQGSGKGTQADLLAEKFNLAHIETGQIFREIGRENSELGKIVKNLNEQKEMIPDEVTVEVLRAKLEVVPIDMGIILDSAPRTTGQVEPIEQMLAELARTLDKAIYITLPYEQSVERITKRYACTVCYRHFVLGNHIQELNDPCPTCGGPIMQRGDDTPEGVAKRLDTFYKVTIPVIDEYRERGMLIEVDGSQTVENVFSEIIEQLEKK